MSDRQSPLDDTPLKDFEIDRRTLLVGVPVAGVALAGCYAGLTSVSNDDGTDRTPGPTETETPFGFGGTPTATATATTTATTATDAPADTPTTTASPSPTDDDDDDDSSSGGGSGSAETPGDYGIQGYGEFGYGGVFP